MTTPYSTWLATLQRGSLDDLQALAKADGIKNFSTTKFSHLPLTVWAIRLNREDLLEDLLNSGFSVREANAFGPLHEAISLGRLDLMTLLLEKGAQLDDKTQHGFLPIDLAAQNAQIDLLSWIYERTHQAPASLIVHLTKQRPNAKTLDFLRSTIDHQMSYQYDGTSARALLNVFLREKDQVSVQKLLDKKAPLQSAPEEQFPDSHYGLASEPLNTIAGMNDAGIAWLDLWGKTADQRKEKLQWDQGEASPVLTAARGQSSALTQRFLHHGSPYEFKGSYNRTLSLVDMAIEQSDLDLMKHLVNMYQVNLNQEKTPSPYHEPGYLEMVAKLSPACQPEIMFDYLLSEGADWKKHAHSDKCAMWHAIEHGNVAIVDRLVELGDNIHKVTGERDKIRAFQRFSHYSIGKPAMLRCLMRHGVDPYIPGANSYQDQPIKKVLERGEPEHIQILMENKFDMDKTVPNKNSTTYRSYLGDKNKKIVQSYDEQHILEKTTKKVKKKTTGPRL